MGIIPGGDFIIQKRKILLRIILWRNSVMSLFVVKLEYNCELDKLNQFENEYLNQTDLDQIAVAKAKEMINLLR